MSHLRLSDLATLIAAAVTTDVCFINTPRMAETLVQDL